MKKRIFAILILALTLALFAFPVFADSYNPEDISFEKIETFSATTQTHSDVLIGKLTLNEGLYILYRNQYISKPHKIPTFPLYFFSNNTITRKKAKPKLVPLFHAGDGI